MFGPGRIGCRELWNLITYLPDGAALWRVADVARAWTTGERMLAGLIDLQQDTNLLLLKAHFKPTGRDPELTRLPRPGQAGDDERPQATIHDFRRALLG